MKLFELKQIEKFFEILWKLDWGIPINNVNNIKSQKQIFVRRTVNKWLKDKLLVLYKTCEQHDLEYKQFIKINEISFALGYGNEIRIKYYNYAIPTSFYKFDLDQNAIQELEGEWSIDETNHNTIKELCSINDLPIKKYVFKAYKQNEWDKHIFINFYAKTEKEAYKLKNEHQARNKDILVCPDIFETITNY